MLIALGLALTISDSIICVYYQQHPQTNPQYIGYLVPLLVTGICITTLGIPAFHRSRMKKRAEALERELLPPPPPPVPPPTPPPYE